MGGRRRIQEEMRSALEEVILVTSDLSLADVIWLTEYEDLDLVGIITEKGGRTSHTAVLSQTLFIPAIVGVTGARSHINNGDTVFVDSNSGKIICNPTEKETKEIEQLVQEQEKSYSLRYRARRRVAETKDHFRVTLKANVAMVNGLDEILHLGAQGIGLFRSEYLFMGRDTLPDEEEQYESYRELIESMGGRPVTIRTIDVGSDKLLTPEARKQGEFQILDEENPALGLRAVRFTLANPSFFISHLRAILRAAAGAPVNILLPMVSTLQELREAKKYIELAKSQLKEEGLKFNDSTPVGIMIELPAVAVRADIFLKEVDFASIGTNDLIQYTLGVDRGNSAVAPLYDELHPSVLTLISMTAKAAQKMNVPLSICGEMGGKQQYAPIFVGMGLKELSMSAMQIPVVKERIRMLEKGACERLVKKLLHQPTSKEVKEVLERFTQRNLPKDV